jgi:hypothetical protein
LFPGVRFIVNTRNLDDTARSGWWARRADSRSQLEQLEERYLAVRERLGDSAFHVRFDDYVRDPATLAPLYEWLDLPLDVEVARRVLEIPHSYDDRLAERG